MVPSEPIIAYCHACGGAMNVAPVAPFSNVECPTCGQHTRVKREFGPYTLHQRHAIGGMSVVFLARDNTLGREVALKILNEDYSADERRIAAFEEEARITASFSHPNVVRVFTTGRAFDRFFIAMEWVSGGHLEQRIVERGKLSEREALPMAIQVAEGLKAAHAAGLIHRDIKPGNILFDAEGNAKIVDFGLALVTQGGLAQAKEMWATPYYVPPETVDGQPEDFRSDVYAFGATLYHALAGKPPCEEESMATDVLREAKKKVTPLRTVAAGLSLETYAVVERAMAYEPDARFGSYDEMLSLLRLAERRAIAAPHEGATRRRHADPGGKLALAGATMVLLAALAFAGWRLTRPAPEPPPVVVPGPADPAPPVPASSSAEPAVATRIASSYRQARAALEAGNYELARVEFAALRDDPHVQEPTRSWSGIEAVAAAYLEGESDQALHEAKATADHVEAALPEEARIRRHLLPVLRQLDSLRPVSLTPAATEQAGAAEVFSWLLAALKNWEQGQPELAAGLFTATAAAELPPEDQWATHYQQLAKDYLADYEILSSPLFDDFPEVPTQVESVIAELNTKLALLKTRGRARFNIRAWQLDLTRHARTLSQLPQKASPDLQEIISQVDELCRTHRFAEAFTYLNSLPNEPEDPAVRSLLSLTKSAAEFLKDLEGDIAKATTALSLELKSGERVTAVSVSAPGKLQGKSSSEEPAEFAWRDFTPESINELYRLLVRGQASEDERIRRHESAIAFEWLAGDRSRAIAAAERLAQENAAFKERWQGIVAELPE